MTPNLELSKLAIAVAAIVSTSAALAQQSTDPAPATAENLITEEVIVKGIRGSLAGAIDQKRNADNLVEVIIAEDIGKLPDQNLAEVLENIPGVQITRTAGVGTGPSNSTFIPVDVSPAVRAFSNM